MTITKKARKLCKKFRKWLDAKFESAPAPKPRRKRKAKNATPFSPEAIPLVAEAPKADPILGETP